MQLQEALDVEGQLSDGHMEHKLRLIEERDALQAQLQASRESFAKVLEALEKWGETMGAVERDDRVICEAWQSGECRLGEGNCSAWKPHRRNARSVCGWYCSIIKRRVKCVPVEPFRSMNPSGHD